MNFNDLLQDALNRAHAGGKKVRYLKIGPGADQLLTDYLSDGMGEGFTLEDVRWALAAGNIVLGGMPCFPMACEGVAAIT